MKPALNVPLSSIQRDTSLSAFPSDLSSDALLTLLKYSVEMAADEVFWIRQDARIFYVNDAACKKLGFARNELLGKHVWELDPIFTQDVWPQVFEELKCKQHIEFETQHQDKNGFVFPVKIQGHYLSHNGEETLFAFVTDLSDIKRQEAELEHVNYRINREVKRKTAQLEEAQQETARYAKELEESNHRYNLAIEGTDVGLWSWDVQTNDNYWSPKFYELLGFQDKEIPPSYAEWERRLHPGERQVVLSALDSHLQNDTKYEVEFRLLCKNRQYRWFRVKGKAKKNDEHIPIFMVGSLEDIHHQKSLEAAFQFEQKKFEEFVNLAPVGIAINRLKDGNFQYVNSKFSRFTGYTTEELNAMDYWELTPSKYANQEQEQLDMMERTARYGPYQKEYIHKKGHFYPVLLSGIKIRGMDNEDYIWSVVEDISDRVRAEKELVLSKRKAEAANEAKSQFLASMSHEIRTPMNGVLGALQLLESEVNDKGKVLLEKSLSSSFSLLRIINDILDFSKIEANKLALENIPFSVSDIAEELVSSFKTKAQSKQLDVTFCASDNAHDAWIGDPVRISQILTNLLSNAIKFTESGYVKLVLSSKDDEVKFDVIDSGIGMNEETVKTLFNPFTQADASTTRKYGGTGLGMAITKHLVSLMKGRINVDSEVSKGTAISVSIPLERTVAPMPVQQENHTTPDLTGLSILIAEDNEINQLIVKSMIEKTHADIRLATNGIEAIDAFNQETPDLILMDIQMPEMDGLTACKAIRCSDTTIPIIALTANVLLEDVQEYLSSGFDGHIGKPIIQTTLFEQLSRFLKQT